MKFKGVKMINKYKFTAKIREIGAKDNPSFSITIDKDKAKLLGLKGKEEIEVTLKRK